MKINKIIFLIILFLIASLFSCKQSTDKKEFHIGFSQAMLNDEWRQSMNNSMKLQASLNPNVVLTISNANYDVQQQITQLKKFITDSVDIIIVSPIKTNYTYN